MVQIYVHRACTIVHFRNCIPCRNSVAFRQTQLQTLGDVRVRQ